MTIIITMLIGLGSCIYYIILGNYFSASLGFLVFVTELQNLRYKITVGYMTQVMLKHEVAKTVKDLEAMLQKEVDNE